MAHPKAMTVPTPIRFQTQYSPMSRESEWELMPAAIHDDVGILPWSPLVGGFLSCKYQRGGNPDGDTRAGSDKDLYQWTSAEYAESDQSWATIDTVVDVANELAVTPSRIALAWIADRPDVAAPVLGHGP